MTLEHDMCALDLDSELVEIADLKIEDLLDFARYGEYDALYAILESEYSYKLASCDDNKISLLHMVAANGHVDCAELLLKCPEVLEKNYINSQNAEGNTPLHWASLNAHVPLVRLLLENGADINIKNQMDRTPFDEAVIHEKFEVSSCIIDFLEKLQDKSQSPKSIEDANDCSIEVDETADNKEDTDN